MVPFSYAHDGADALAVAGAEKHLVSSEVVAKAQKRKGTSMVVQKMMIAVLKARFRAEAQATDSGDRGSDPGECVHDTNDFYPLDDDPNAVEVRDIPGDVEMWDIPGDVVL